MTPERTISSRGVPSLLLLSLSLVPAVRECADGDGPNGPPPPPPTQGLAAEVVATGLEAPTYLASPPGDPRRFIVERVGRIRILDGSGTLLPTPFLDLADRVGSGGERGLLSVAFHPQYAVNGHFFVNFTDRSGDTRVERFTISANPDRADPATAKPVLFVQQPFSNHNGGQLAFGPDGYLFVFMGDGGSGGDPQGNGQDLGTLLGAILRLDVDVSGPYAIPPDNPFLADPAAREEIWAIGVRNPWRASFDPPSEMLYVADVGQNEIEEVNAVPASEAALNYGWNVLEGSACFRETGCDRSGLVLPVLEYDHDEGCSVTGGYVYRGSAIPEVVGHYFYSDFCSGFLRSFRLVDGEAVEPREWDVGDLGQVTSFGVDATGELYILSIDGTLRRLVPGD